jgi:hypothetical protein
LPAPLRHLTTLLLLTLGLALGGCAGSESAGATVALRYKTSIERRATLSLLRQAWDDRPMRIDDENKWIERRLLNRIGVFGKKINGTETFRPASQFWLECLHEHQSRYDD